MTNYSSYKLFSAPSLIEGMARVLDIGATLQKYNVSKSDIEADMQALKSDWKIVGSDIEKAVSKYDKHRKA